MLCSVLALTVATTSSPLYATNFWTDSNLYFTIGRGMLEGLMPYRDLFDHKGPLIFLLYALGALVSDTSFFGVFLLEAASLAAMLFFAQRTVALYGRGRLTLAAIPLTAVVTVCATAFNQGGSAEEFCLPALSLALYCALRRMREGEACRRPARLYAAFGAAMGWVFSIKYTDCGLFFGLGLALLLYDVRVRGVRRAIASGLWMLLGMAAVVLPIGAYLAVSGVLDDMIQVYFIQNIFGYGEASMSLSAHVYNALAYLRTQSAANPAVAGLAVAGCAFAAAHALLRREKGFLLEAAAVPLQGVKRADMAQTVFAGIMNEEENPTLLDLTSLDQGFYLAAGITPSCRYFANNNLNTREKREVLDEYLAQGRTMFVVSRWEDPGEHYALIAEHNSPFDLNDTRAYKLYRRVE